MIQLQQQQQQTIAWNAMSDDGWNARSLSSFQTFPRLTSPSTSSDSSGSSSSSSSSSSGASSGSASPPGLTNGGLHHHHKHSHSKSLVSSSDLQQHQQLKKISSSPHATATTPIIGHGHSRSLGQPSDFTAIGHEPAQRQTSLIVNAEVIPPPPDRVDVTLGPDDRRFGFSVVGGREEGFPPRIDEIAPGSPADRADLEIGDEILEVNGKSLDGATHTEVISHIHQCIRSRTICLRVKRKSGNKLAQDLAANSNVQDAFVIAVERQARERLERLSALKKIKPVDMTKLSQQLQGVVPSRGSDEDDDDEEEVKRGGKTPSPQPLPPQATSTTPTSHRREGVVRVSVSAAPAAAVTSAAALSPEPVSVISPFGSPSTWIGTNQSSSTGDSTTTTTGDVHINGDHVTQVRVDAIVLTTPTEASTSRTPPPPQPFRSDNSNEEENGDDDVVGEEDRDQSELVVSAVSGKDQTHQQQQNLHHHVTAVQVEHVISPPPTGGLKLGRPFSEADSSGNSTASSSNNSNRPASVGGQWGSSSIELSGQHNPDAMGALNGNPSMRSSTGAGSSRGTSGRSVGGTSTSQSSEADQHDNWAAHDAGPHREMAVDVPDTFVGRTKTPPRYPPPKATATAAAPIAQVTAVAPVLVNNNSPGLRKKVVTAQAVAAAKPTPPSRDHLRTEEDGRLVIVNHPPTAQIPTRVQMEEQQPTAKLGDQPTAQQMDRIRKYQEDERKRKEKEERIAREEEFLRSSLRGSRKLQALEETSNKAATVVKPVTGVVNVAYTGQDEDDSITSDPGFANSSAIAWASALAQNNYLLNGGMQKIIGLQDVTAALQRLQQQLKKNGHAGQGVEADLAAVQSLLLSPAFRSALTIHSKVQEVWCCGQPTLPAHSNVQQLVTECLSGLQQCGRPEALELVSLLSRYEVEGLLYAHDRIAEAGAISTAPLSDAALSTAMLDATMSSSDVGMDAMMQESAFISSSLSTGQYSPAHSAHSQDRTFKIIRLEKSNEPLGATVRNDGESVVVGRIVRGGVAERSGLLHEGDEILEVNGVEVRGKSINDVCDLVGSMTGTITFLIVPVAMTNGNNGSVGGVGKSSLSSGGGQIGSNGSSPVVHLKAHFDYDPEDDLYIPCKELGISFMKGDILHVISQEDANWWQAFREGEEDQTLAGLIPSRSFQQQREAVKQAMVIDTTENEITSRASKAGTLLCARKQQHKKKKRTSFRSNFGKDESDEILTYEEVGLYYPRANHKRPIVLIGPPNIGRKELREMLMQDSERFAPAIPHTSRTKKDSEINSQDYHFISRAQFEADIVNRRFVEHGEYERAYYGTTVDAIRAVVLAGKFCVLNLHPQSLKILKESDLMPFVVFVAPPSLEKLRAKKRDRGETVKDDELKEIIEKAREMEEVYGHYFDMVIVNGDEERTYGQLLTEVNRLEREPQWVPATWLDRSTDHK